MLATSNREEFYQAVIKHGPVRDEEIPLAYQETKSAKGERRLHAALFLRYADPQKAAPFRERVLQETEDLEVWASFLSYNDAGEEDFSLVSRRPAMIQKALQSPNLEIFALGLRLGALSHLPGVHELVLKNVHSPHFQVRTARLAQSIA